MAQQEKAPAVYARILYLYSIVQDKHRVLTPEIYPLASTPMPAFSASLSHK